MSDINGREVFYREWPVREMSWGADHEDKVTVCILDGGLGGRLLVSELVSNMADGFKAGLERFGEISGNFVIRFCQRHWQV